MRRAVVADAGPLIAIPPISRPELLHQGSGPVVILPSVSAEVRTDSGLPEGERVAGWLE